VCRKKTKNGFLEKSNINEIGARIGTRKGLQRGLETSKRVRRMKTITL